MDYSTNQEIVDLLCDFLQVWIHQILYHRDIYPNDAFALRKKYNVPVRMMTHPGVNRYVADFVSSIQPLLTMGSCRSVSLVVLSAQQRPLERFVFEVETLSRKLNPQPLSVDGSNQTRACVQQHIRACLLKIHACESILSANPSGCTYCLSAEIHSESFPPQAEKQVGKGCFKQGGIKLCAKDRLGSCRVCSYNRGWDMGELCDP
ncbi:DNA-binding protein [Phycomyces nitens]|nr:DNA-binding protein [Phycomyces nitens]